MGSRESTERSVVGGWEERTDAAVLHAPHRLLRWVYVGRLVLASGILLGALAAWGDADAEGTFLATVAFAAAVAFTGFSLWYTHVRGGEPGHGFRYAQVFFDALLVTLVVDITGGVGSPFAWLYIPVISVGAILLPLPGGILMGLLVSVLFLGAVVWRHDTALTGPVALLMALFTLVALATGILGDRLRRAGLALGEVESELRRLRLDTGDILDTIDSGILTVDADSRLVYLNPAGQELLGVRGQEWTGEPMEDVLGRVSPDLVAVLGETLSSERPLPRQTARVQRPQGTATLGISTTTREGKEGPAVTAIFQDITLAERLAEARRRADRLQAVAALSASMAHEIKNPLASIRSAVEQLTRPSLEREDQELLKDMVVKESERLSRLLSDFIDFSRIRRQEVEDVDLACLVEEAMKMVRQNPELESEVTLEAEGVAAPVIVSGDPDILHRAISNLILNAAQFSGENGRVEITVEDHRQAPNPPPVGIPKPVSIAVGDSGPGVPEDEVAQIFDPFYTTRKGGSGLGLAVVHRAVEVHEGAIFVENGPGGGARFTLYLPGDGPPQDTPPRQESERLGGGSRHRVGGGEGGQEAAASESSAERMEP